jgi:tellurite resistance protein
MARPSEQLRPSQRALLQIVCWVAWADGDFAEEERQLLERIVADTMPEAASPILAAEAAARLVGDSPEPEALENLVRMLESDDQRQLAVKLAYQMVSASRQDGDPSAVNREEKAAYRRLVEALGLDDTAVQEAEWAARQDLGTGSSAFDLLASGLMGLGAWPSADMLGLSMGHWL